MQIPPLRYAMMRMSPCGYVMMQMPLCGYDFVPRKYRKFFGYFHEYFNDISITLGFFEKTIVTLVHPSSVILSRNVYFVDLAKKFINKA